MKSTNTNIWLIGTLSQMFFTGFYAQTSFQIKKTNKVVSGKTPFFVIGPFCTPDSVCINTGFWQGSFVWKCCVFNHSIFNL